MNFGDDWMVIGMIDDFVVQDENRSYYYERVVQCVD